MPKYPKINEMDFQKDITKKFPKYVIKKKKKRMEDICYPKNYQLQIPQQFVADFMNPNSPYTGLLIDHQIGAGKTCAGINIAEGFKGKKKIIAVMPASLKGGFRDELRSPCTGNSYVTDRERAILRKNDRKSSKYLSIIKKSDEKINKYYDIYSYNKFISKIDDGSLNLDDALLIIDEVHNLISSKGSYYKKTYDAIHSAPSSLRLVLMTATPIYDSPNEIALLMNLFLKDDKQMPVGQEFNKMFIKARKSGDDIKYSAKNLDKFKKYIAGYVSYYRGAPAITFPDYKLSIVEVNMSEMQRRTYDKIKNIEKKEVVDPHIKNNSFLIGTRKVSNAVYPRGKMGSQGLKLLKNSDYELGKMAKYSPKFVAIYKNIRNQSSPSFIYSNFKEYSGILFLAKFLEYHGYQNYEDHGPGKNRYAIWSGDIKSDVRNRIKSIFNHPTNADGSQIQLMLGSPSIKEGVSLLRVRQVHIIEPYWNHSRMDQVIGRAFRYCSHKDLPKDQRNVRVFIYIAVHPKIKVSVDRHVLNIADKKLNISNPFNLAIKEASVDCKLFKNDNLRSGEPNINCSI